MKKFYLFFAAILLFIFSLQAQNSYLEISDGYKANDTLINYQGFSAFDIQDTLLYGNEGDTIRCINMKTGVEIKKFSIPNDYSGFPSFVTLSPNGKEIWTGYTVSGNTDDRIFCIDIETRQWKHEATLAGNFDLAFWSDSILVSGLNSTNWSDPNKIFKLDTTAGNNHKVIIEVGGYSAGLGVMPNGDIVYASNYAAGNNTLLKWDSSDCKSIINDETDVFLTNDDATVLSTLENGAYDCEVDQAGNIVFNLNPFSSDKVLAIWDNTTSEENNYDTLALATGGADWLNIIKTKGNVRTPKQGNHLFALGLARPLAEVHTDFIPVLINPVERINGIAGEEENTTNLSNRYIDPDDPEISLSFEIMDNSIPDVATASIDHEKVVIDFLEAGQTNVLLKIISNGNYATEKIAVGTQAIIQGDEVLSDMENHSLEQDSYWNGSDESGGFESGLAFFVNSYNPAWAAWNGWAYTNMQNDTTPGWMNQYSAITGVGVSPESKSNYAVAFPSPASKIKFAGNSAHQVKGFFVTNSTYSALSMKFGDDFAKKFGGETGNDPDWFKLAVWGLKNGAETDTINFYLADYRFEDNKDDYIIQSWQWVETSSLGKVDSLMFSLSSSDNGAFGMNTPGYFCLDNLHVVPDQAPTVINPISNITAISLAENQEIDISNVFTDEDDDDNQIIKSIVSNSDNNVASAEIVDNTFTIDFLAVGETEIVIEALSNKKTAYDTLSVTVTPSAGIHNSDHVAITLFPNPTNGKFSILTSDNSSTMLVRLYDFSGNLIYQDNNYYSQEFIDISNQPAGNYLLKIIENKNIYCKTLLKH